MKIIILGKVYEYNASRGDIRDCAGKLIDGEAWDALWAEYSASFGERQADIHFWDWIEQKYGNRKS